MSNFRLDRQSVRVLQRTVDIVKSRPRKSDTYRRRRGKIGRLNIPETFEVLPCIVVETIPAGEWDPEEKLWTPGYAKEESSSGEDAIDSIMLFTYGLELGAPATFLHYGRLENYSLSEIEVGRGLKVFERRANIWVPITQYCDLFDIEGGSS